jgi:D-arabinose 1-dehydrogenase-like Zn-dependent alcohol dehydrogenase
MGYIWRSNRCRCEIKYSMAYSKQVRLKGSTGSTRKEITELIDMSKELKTRVWKKFMLDEAKEALQALFDKERDGRILLEVS